MSKIPYSTGSWPEKNPHEPWAKHPDWYDRDKKPKVITIADLFPQLDQLSIGYLPILNNLKQITTTKPSYPPYNIKKFKDGKWTIELALAGFLKEQIKVEVQDQTLSISSAPTELTSEGKEAYEAEDIHQGIAARMFNLKFALAEYVEVDSATYLNGILKVTLVTNLPEEKKPKVIEIN